MELFFSTFCGEQSVLTEDQYRLQMLMKAQYKTFRCSSCGGWSSWSISVWLAQSGLFSNVKVCRPGRPGLPALYYLIGLGLRAKDGLICLPPQPHPPPPPPTTHAMCVGGFQCTNASIISILSPSHLSQK